MTLAQSQTYQYFETKTWTGRLDAPVHLRGSPVARRFDSGRIGGRKLDCQERFEDTPEGRKRLLMWTRAHQFDR